MRVNKLISHAEMRRWTNFGRNRRVHKSHVSESKNSKAYAFTMYVHMCTDEIYLNKPIYRKNYTVFSLYFYLHKNLYQGIFIYRIW